MVKKQAFLALFCLMVFATISHYSCTKDAGRLPAALSQSLCDSLNVKFSTVIKPMMQANCVTGCHDGSGTTGAPLDLNSYAALKIFYDNGELKHRVFTLKDMPQAPNPPLADSCLQQLQCWINDSLPNN